jgi:hypothetical protein
MQQSLTLILNLIVYLFLAFVVVFAIARASNERLQNKTLPKSPRNLRKSTTPKLERTLTKLKEATVLEKPQPTTFSPVAIAQKTKETLDETLALPELLAYKTHPNSQIRQLVASGLGKMAREKQLRAEIQPAITVLGQLSQDTEPTVRQAAAIALGEIKSEKVLPFLKRALRDFDSDVVKSASAALNQFKSYPVKTQPKKKPAPKGNSKFKLSN